MTFMTLFAIIYTVMAFLVFWLAYFMMRNYLKRFFSEENTFRIGFVIFHRVFGFLLFGLLPILIGFLGFQVHWKSWGLLLEDPTALLLWSLGIIILLIPLNRYASKTKANQAIYPQMRVKEWTNSLFFLNAGLWILYLLGYEFVFRGLLFFTTLPYFGLWPAILLNATLYALVHIPKGLREIGGGFIFGIFLCLGCYYTGGFWFAFLVHTFQAVFNEYHSIRFNPQMFFTHEKEKVEIFPSRNKGE